MCEEASPPPQSWQGAPNTIIPSWFSYPGQWVPHTWQEQLCVAGCRHSHVGVSCEVTYLPDHTLPPLTRRHLP